MKTSNKKRLFKNETNKRQPLFEVQNLSISFLQYKEGLHETKDEVISDLNLSVHKGEIVAVVGASGSGKSLLANAILGILPHNCSINGVMKYNGEPLTKENQDRLRGNEISLIPQSVNALDPLMKIGKQIKTVIKENGKEKIMQQILRKVGLDEKVANLYPFELSGGMARRVLVATAMVSGAQLIIADEPTPGLDPFVLEETVTLLRVLANEGKGIMFISHDIETAIKVADKVAVFYAGQTIEIAHAADFTGNGEKLRHPYTKALWNALPQNEFKPVPSLKPIGLAVEQGCFFQSSCPMKTDVCTRDHPKSREVNDGTVRCFHA